MATLSVEKLTLNDGTALAGTTLAGTTSTDHSISRVDAARLIIYVKTAGTAGTLSVYAGDNPPAFRASQGSVAVGIAANTTKFIPVESARFAQSDGTITLNQTFLADATVAVIELPDDL